MNDNQKFLVRIWAMVFVFMVFVFTVAAILIFGIYEYRYNLQMAKSGYEQVLVPNQLATVWQKVDHK